MCLEVGRGDGGGAFQDSLTRGSDSLVSRAATMSLINRKRAPPLPPPVQKKRFLSYLAIMDHFAQQRPEKKRIYKKETTLSRARIRCIHL